MTTRLTAIIALLVLLPALVASQPLPLSKGYVIAGQSEPPQKPAQDPPPKPPQKPAEKPAEKPPPDQDEPVKLSSRLVLVPVSVSDAAGKPVRNLTADDFVIEEDGKPQQITALGEPGKAPIEIAMLFDVSGSIHSQFAFEQQAAVRFIKEVLKPGDGVSVFAIGTTPQLVKPRTTNSEEAIKGLMAIEPVKAATAFFDAVTEAALYLGKNADSGSRHVLVIISDGEENYSAHYKLNDALRELQKNDCLFYSINPTGLAINLNTISAKGQGYMEAMSTQTGGKAFAPAKLGDLESVFHQITEELQAQYLFGYYATGERTGGFKRITVRAPKQPDLRVRARQGYYTPGGANP